MAHELNPCPLHLLEKTLGSPLDCKEIKPVSPKGNKSWVFTGKTNAEAPILWPPDRKNWLIGKDPDCWERLKAGRKGDDREQDGWMTLPTWWTWVWAPGVGDGQRSLACCSPWGDKKSDTTERLNWIPAFAGGFLSTGPPAKFSFRLYLFKYCLSNCLLPEFRCKMPFFFFFSFLYFF